MLMIQIESLQPADGIPAISLALARVPPEERPALLAHWLNQLASGTLDASAIRIARSEDGAIIGTQVCMPLAGAFCQFWLPTAEDGVAEQLIQACLQECRSRRIKVAQTFLATAEIPYAQPLLRQGFHHVTRLHHLSHGLIELPSAAPSTLRFETMRTHQLNFVRTLQRTYEGTLDCPELNGKRTMEEIIAGHQAAGKFDSDRWWLTYEGDQEVGVLILAELPDELTWELAYLGIVPPYRRRGHGRAMLSHALKHVRERMATHLLVAVDGRNAPALQLYQSAGFKTMESYEVLLYFLDG